MANQSLENYEQQSLGEHYAHDSGDHVKLGELDLHLLTFLKFVTPSLMMDSIHEMIRLMRAARVLVDLSQEELARRAGISRQMLVRIEKKGARGVPVDALESVREALEQSGVEFIQSTTWREPGIALLKSGALKPQ